MRALSLAVVGADHPNKRGPTRRFEIALCKPGEPVELRREPNNPADPRAIAVYSEREVKMGYLTAERAPMIGSAMLAGRELQAVFQEHARWGAVIRLAMDGASLALPEVAEQDADRVIIRDEFDQREWTD